MIARDGLRFVIPAWIVAVILIGLYLISNASWLLILWAPVMLCALFVTYFFRDPERTPPRGDNLILSPGDGKVILVEEQVDDRGNNCKLVSIFLSVFNVHVNRIPISGVVTRVEHRQGKFLKAFEREAVIENERTEITIKSTFGVVKFSQVAGIIARRIVCYLRDNETVTRGERFGMIRFGSRVDLFLGSEVDIRVSVGDRVKGGESIIGSFKQSN